MCFLTGTGARQSSKIVKFNSGTRWQWQERWQILILKARVEADIFLKLRAVRPTVTMQKESFKVMVAI